VPDYLTIQFVHQFINGGVEISVGTFCKHVASFDMNIAFSTLPSFLFLLFFNGQQYFDINYLVKVAGYSIQLGRDVISQCRGNFNVVTADRQVHG
jgi:hypothetical protein